MQKRSGRSHSVSPPSIVPGASMRPTVGMPWAARPCLEGGWLACTIGLAGPERDRAAIGHEERVEGVDEVRAFDLGLEDVDLRTERSEQLDERCRAPSVRPRGRPGGGSHGPSRRTLPRTIDPAASRGPHGAAPTCSGRHSDGRSASSAAGYRRPRPARVEQRTRGADGGSPQAATAMTSWIATSTSSFTLSPTSQPPASSATFQSSPQSFRFTVAFAEKPARRLPSIPL